MAINGTELSIIMLRMSINERNLSINQLILSIIASDMSNAPVPDKKRAVNSS